MMKTPICDFVKAYSARETVRLHMPGHKGECFTGPEKLDITEVDGADVLYSARGIIRESQENAAAIFGSGRTLYSCEGSSLCIRAMLHLIGLHARSQGRPPLILAARNAHKVFMTGSALCGVEISWLYPTTPGSITACPLDLHEVERRLKAEKPCALYVTSPDYLGNLQDIQALSRLCHAHGALLAVDNAHGAYLKFLGLHPLDLGADIMCDSAHKTLPVLTGGAYLHISARVPRLLREQAENAMALFASTSPSYLILQSLDGANPLLAGEYPEQVRALAHRLAQARETLRAYGYQPVGQEPAKITLLTKPLGWRGDELAARLMEEKVSVEFADPDHVVMMFSPQIPLKTVDEVTRILTCIPRRQPLTDRPPVMPPPRRVMIPRDALFAVQEKLPVREAAGRVLASPSVTCPPAVPIAVCGEEISAEACEVFAYYGIESCYVVK